MEEIRTVLRLNTKPLNNQAYTGVRRMTVSFEQVLNRLKAYARFFTVSLAIISLGTQATAQVPQKKIDLDALSRIKAEELNHSRGVEMVGYLTDVIGPRLTGSPKLKQAQEYALNKARNWGLTNAHTEAWGPFGRGWSLEGFTANMVAPSFSSLIAYPKAWSPGTDGPVRGEVVFLDVKTAADLAKYRGKLAGKIVL